MKTKNFIYFIFIVCIACNTNNKNETKNNQINTENIKIKEEIKIDTFSTVPEEMVGCGCSFYFNETDIKNEKFFWLDVGNKALIYINGKAQKLSLKKYDETENSSEFYNDYYLIYYRILKSSSIGEENTHVEGIMKIKSINNNDSLKLRFIGICGC